MFPPGIDLTQSKGKVHSRTELMPAEFPADASALHAIATECQRALEANPESVWHRMSLANALSDLGNFEQAIAEYGKAILDKSELWNAFHFRANAKARLGDFEGAARDFDSAASRIDVNAAFCIDVAWFLATCPVMAIRRGNDPRSFVKKAQQLLDTTATVDAEICLAVIYADRGDFKKAIARLTSTATKSAYRFGLISELLRKFELSLPHRDVFLPRVVCPFPLTFAENHENTRSQGHGSPDLLGNSGSLTSLTRPGQDVQVTKGMKTGQEAIAVKVLTEKRSDVHGLLDILSSADFPTKTRDAIRNWLDTGLAETAEERMGRIVSELRQARGWSRRKLERESGVSHVTIRNIETAAFSCEFHNLCLLAAAFEKSPRTLLYPEQVTTRAKPLKPEQGLSALAKTIRGLLPSGGPTHASIDGILRLEHYPSLRVLTGIAGSLGTSLEKLLP